SASYYAAARSNGNPRFAGDRAAQAPSYRGSSAGGYGYGRGNGGSASAANQGYRTSAVPSANYAGNRQAMTRPGTNIAPRSYAGRVPSYNQQRYAANSAYTRGAAPSYSAPRGSAPRASMPAYSNSGHGAMPSYARGGSYSAPRGGGSYSAPRG